MKKIKVLLFIVFLSIISIFSLSSCLNNMSPPTDIPTQSNPDDSTDSEKAEETGTPPSVVYNSEIKSNNYNPIVSLYAYEQLSAKEQEIYNQMKNALLNYAPSIENGLEDFSSEQLNRISKFVFIDSPEIFWAAEGGKIYTSELNGVKTVKKFEFNYIMSQSEKEEMQNQINISAKDFLDGIEPNLNEYERTFAVYEYLILTVNYDTDVMNKIANGIKDTETWKSQTIASAFIDKETVCNGYSKATQYLLNKLGIFCTYVSGGAKGQANNHAWNLVKVDGDYYLLDTTWGNPLSVDPSQERRITYNYFLLTDHEFNASHTPNNDIILPECTATKYNYFVYNNLFFSEYNLLSIEKLIRNATADKQNGVSIKFSDENIADNAKKSLFDNNGTGIFDILKKAAAVNAELDAKNISYSFDPEVNVFYIKLSYNK